MEVVPLGLSHGATSVVAAWTTRSWRASRPRTCAGATTCADVGSRARSTAGSGMRTGPPTCGSRCRTASKKTRASRNRSSDEPRTEAFVEPHELEPEQRALYRAATRGYLDAFGGVIAQIAPPRLPHRAPRSRRGAVIEPRPRSRAPRRRPGAAQDPGRGPAFGAPDRCGRNARRARPHRGVGTGTTRHRRRRRDRATPGGPHTRPRGRPRRGPRMDRRSGRTLSSSSRPIRGRAPVATARVAHSYRAARSIRADAGDAHEASALRHRLAHPEQLRRLLPLPAALLLHRAPRTAGERPDPVDRPGSADARHAAQDPRRRRVPRRVRMLPTYSSRTVSTRRRSARWSRAMRTVARREPSRAPRTRSMSPASIGSRLRCSWPPPASTRCGSTTGTSTRATTRPAGSSPTPSPTSTRPMCRRTCWRSAPRLVVSGFDCATSTCNRRSTRIPSRGSSTTSRWPRSKRSSAPRSNACGEQDEWRGVAEVDVCRTCRYRSICRDSAAPGEPAWPVSSTDPAGRDRRRVHGRRPVG